MAVETLKRTLCRLMSTKVRNHVASDQAMEMVLRGVAIESGAGISSDRLRRILAAGPCLQQLSSVLEADLGFRSRQHDLEEESTYGTNPGK